MANNALNVTAGKPKITGAVWVAPKTATLPSDAKTTLTGDYVCLGYVSEDGLENNNELTVSSVKAWGGNIVLRSLEEMVDEFSLALIESENLDVLKAVYGASNVTFSNGLTSVNVVASDPEEKIWVFELALRNNILKRIVIPTGAITSREAITYNDSDPVAYGITISAYPDSNGSTHKDYMESSSVSA